MASDKHALLSPSAAHIWMHCPASARAAASIVRPYCEEPQYVKEGVLAHEIAAHLLQELDIYKPLTAAQRDKIANLGLNEEGIIIPVYKYISEVLNVYHDLKRLDDATELHIERRLGSGVPNCFGTADAIVIGDNTCHVFDFKFGTGLRVSAINNPQLLIYACGVKKSLLPHCDIDAYHLHIVQPRLDHTSCVELDADELEWWKNCELRPAAALANSQGIEPADGEWCRFCKAAPLCPLLACKAASLTERYKTLSEENDGILPVETIPALLDLLQGAKKWVSAFETYASGLLMKRGGSIDGWKLVQGRKHQTIKDSRAVLAALKNAKIRQSLYLKPKELRPLGELKKRVPARAFARFVEPCVEEERYAPQIARSDDPREAYTPSNENTF